MAKSVPIDRLTPIYKFSLELAERWGERFPFSAATTQKKHHSVDVRSRRPLGQRLSKV